MQLSQRRMLSSVLIAFGVLVVLATSASSAIKQSTGTFSVDLPLSKPTTLGPANGANLTYPADPLKLTWRAVPGAATYDLQIARQASSTVDCNSTSAWQADNILLTHNTPELGWVPELTEAATGSGIWTGTYCFRVRAAGTTPGVWSDGSRFALTWTAQASNLRFYSDESGDVPRAAGAAGDASGFDTGYLEWDPVAGATQYEVQISNATTFGAASMFADKTYPSTRLLLPQMPDNQYTWRVRPVTSTGIKGSWSATANFRIFHDDRYWGGANNGTSDALFPAEGAVTNDVRIGWEPVPGASYYQFEAISIPTTFSEIHNMEPYGGFQDEETCSGSVDGRISPKGPINSGTVNNWVTFAGLFGTDVIDAMTVECEYPIDPDGIPESGDETIGKRLPPIPDEFHWRVYPVWQLSSATEQAWNVAATKILGKPVERSFVAEPYDPTTVDAAYQPVAGSKCAPTPLAYVDCLRNIGGGLSPRNPTMNSTTMQVPVFEWGAYPGYYANKGPGSFRVQIAQDSQFDFMLGQPGADPKRGWIANRGPSKRDEWATDSRGMQAFGGITRSFALTTGLPDEGLQDGDGYFWRSIPCQSGSAEGLCVDKYKDATDLQHSPGIAFGQPGSGALQFHKRVEVSTAVINGFTPTTPMLRVGPVGAASFADWQRGIQGADHYEFEIARNLAFDDGNRTLKTTVPRMVPWGATPADVLEAGTWFWRVRAVDRDGLTGSWSNASSFTAVSPAPTISSSSSTIGVGGTVEWAPSNGAVGYQIEWSADSGFATNVTTKDTRQTAYYIPASAAGQLYWRVRARTGTGVYGQWSDARAITILSPSRITYGLSRGVVAAGQTAIVEAALVVAGTVRNNQRVQLQRKTSSCEGKGRYRTITTQTTGRNLDDGLVRVRMRVRSSACYRFAWKYSTGTMYSAAFAIGARPIVSFRPLQRKVKRGRSFCSRITSRQAITGTLRIQYRVGRTWVTSKSQNVRGMKRRTQCAAINRGGVFPVRLVIENMIHPRTRWKLYDNTMIAGGIVKTADSFVIIRHRR